MLQGSRKVQRDDYIDVSATVWHTAAVPRRPSRIELSGVRQPCSRGGCGAAKSKSFLYINFLNFSGIEIRTEFCFAACLLLIT